MPKIIGEITPEVLSYIASEKELRGTDEVFLLFAMGSQFDHHIKLALERLGVFCLVVDPARATKDGIKKIDPIGMIVSGGPASVHVEPPPFDGGIFDLGIPTLGICLGFQMWARHIGVSVKASSRREFGVHPLYILDTASVLFAGCQAGTLPQVLENHGDCVGVSVKLRILASTEHAPVAAAQYKHLVGVQFHPEVTHTPLGMRMLENFCFGLCHAHDKYPAENVAKAKIERLREQISGKKVLLALSGGTDSSVVAYLMKHALEGSGGHLDAIYIKGIDRPDDEAHVLEYFGHEPWINLNVVDARREFLLALAGKDTMRDKRLAVRDVYKRIIEQEILHLGSDYVAQGTLYTDISESGGGYQSGARKAEIKIHHNTNLHFSIPELTPLDDCFKDGARNIGRSIGVPEIFLVRHPFPGPGLVVRIEGEVTEEKLAIAHAADSIYITELRKRNLYDTVWQAGATVTRSCTTCVKGDDAAEGVVIALWAVWSVDGFTATWAELPDDFLRHVSRRLTNEIEEVGAVVQRISDKPPATIEWG